MLADELDFVIGVDTHRDVHAFCVVAAGILVANRLANLLVDVPNERIAVDFTGVDLVSASFADEFLAKLIKRYGVATFLARVSLRNMSSLVSRTVNAVVAQRIKSED